MKPLRDRIFSPRTWIIILVLGGASVAMTLAQGRPAGPTGGPSYFEYVGVGASLLRIERDSGRIEILEQRNSPNMNLAMEQARPWTWREIRVDHRAAQPPDTNSRGISKSGIQQNE